MKNHCTSKKQLTWNHHWSESTVIERVRMCGSER